ncbi:MAG: GGDEF domain-containing protein [Verrucomicrobiota bacterium]|nr:GGDEF domain-containing protein [Verrucomicrobiota bacterium]
MKKWAPLAFPAGLFLILFVLLASSSAAGGWSESGVVRRLPYLLFSAALAMGYFFAQSRVLFMALLLAAVTGEMNYWFFVREDLPRGETVVFFSALYAPVLMALFYHLGERGVFNAHGVIRLGIVASGAAAIALLPLSSGLCLSVARTRLPPFQLVADWLPIPWSGLAFMVVGGTFLFARKPRESPLLGPTFAFTLLFALGMLAFRSTLWRPNQERAILLLFASGAGATLAWAVLETTWRNAYLDDLTELPGRRALKNHLARLGGNFALAVLDVDHFKKINDRYGHDTGDEALRYIASHLKKLAIGAAYRYGGEEFVIVAEGDDYDAVLAVLDALRLAIQEREFVARGVGRPRRRPTALPGLSDATAPRTDSAGGAAMRKTIRVTVSIGAARRDGRNPAPLDVLGAADRALYRAKKGGRNRVVGTR